MKMFERKRSRRTKRGKRKKELTPKPGNKKTRPSERGRDKSEPLTLKPRKKKTRLSERGRDKNEPLTVKHESKKSRRNERGSNSSEQTPREPPRSCKLAETAPRRKPRQQRTLPARCTPTCAQLPPSPSSRTTRLSPPSMWPKLFFGKQLAAVSSETPDICQSWRERSATKVEQANKKQQKQTPTALTPDFWHLSK